MSDTNATDSAPLFGYGIRACRGHWHITRYGEDLSDGISDDRVFYTRESALAEAERLNRLANDDPFAYAPGLAEAVLAADETFPVDPTRRQEKIVNASRSEVSAPRPESEPRIRVIAQEVQRVANAGWEAGYEIGTKGTLGGDTSLEYNNSRLELSAQLRALRAEVDRLADRVAVLDDTAASWRDLALTAQTNERMLRKCNKELEEVERLAQEFITPIEIVGGDSTIVSRKRFIAFRDALSALRGNGQQENDNDNG